MAAGITKELYFIEGRGPDESDRPRHTRYHRADEGTVMPEWLPYGLFCFTMVYRTASYSGELNSYRDMWNVTRLADSSLRKRAVNASRDDGPRHQHSD